jgi:hypothetical protein
MMPKRDVVACVLGLAVLACSGRYEGGGLDETGGSKSVGSSGASGSDEPDQPPSGLAGTAMVAGGASGQEPSCVYSGDVTAVAGPFASPDVVWRRIAPLIWGREAAPPSALPAETTYAWAGQLASQGLAQAAAAHDFSSSENAVPGARTLLRSLLHVADDTPLSRDWNVLLSSEEPVLRVLLLHPLQAGPRVGIFAEPAWLQAHAGISSRGYVMVEALFGMPVPPPPAGLMPAEPMDGLTRRQHLEQQVSNPACTACHRMFDPLGVSLEHFGADGNYRTVDAGLPVDSSGVYDGIAELGAISFVDHVDLGARLAEECRVKLGFADTFLRVALEKAGTSNDATFMTIEANRERIQQAFVRGGLTYASLVRAFAQSPAALRP